MISVEEASAIILSHLYAAHPEYVALEDAVGRILAENIFADRDLPPFDRVTMDGIALRNGQFQQGTRRFRILAVQAAGDPPIALTDATACVEVMTGAVLPKGADTVVRYEDVTLTDGFATVNIEKVALHEAIHFQGADAKQGAELLAPGICISAAEIALLAATGQKQVAVKRFPITAIISTGDELVDVGETPLPQQIRRSNSYALQASLKLMGCHSSLFHIADDEKLLREKLARVLEQHELVILSGGVSKGKFDFVPGILKGLGIVNLFHQVSQRPGKPFWFGHAPGRTVFALPGNPVSTYCGFYRYIRPWLLRSMGADASFGKAVLATDFSFSLPLTYFLQVKIKNVGGRLMAYPQAGGGSGDFANLRDADGFLELPAGQSVFHAGEIFSFIPFR